MTNEQILTCAINIGEQLLINGAEISRVEDTISRICSAYGVRQSHIFHRLMYHCFPGNVRRGVDYPDQENIKLRHEYV